ncbi:MAG TPA: phospholipase domain-containing protein, partial [Caulobacteraceae bacterium]
IRNAGAVGETAIVARGGESYGARRHRLQPGAVVIDRWDLAAGDNWYDFTLTSLRGAGFGRRFAGHGENGRPSVSDPKFGKRA